MEIKTEGRFQMTREPAMKTLGRLCDFDAYAAFGRGVKGRQKALVWLQETITENEKIYGLEPGETFPADA
jgi:hypothetical protein